MKPGISEAVLSLLKKKVQCLPDIGKICIITYDEMALKKELKYDRKADEIIGLVNLDRKLPIACNQALVFMAKGICLKWKQPISFHFSNNAAGADSLCAILMHLLRRLFEIGLKPVAAVCDQGSCNRALYRKLDVNVSKPFFEVKRMSHKSLDYHH